VIRNGNASTGPIIFDSGPAVDEHAPFKKDYRGSSLKPCFDFSASTIDTAANASIIIHAC
jgi:hypothetical protein